MITKLPISTNLYQTISFIKASNGEDINRTPFPNIIDDGIALVFPKEESPVYEPFYSTVPDDLEKLKYYFVATNIQKQFCCEPFGEWRMYVAQAFLSLADKYVPLFESLEEYKEDILGYGKDVTHRNLDGTVDYTGTDKDIYDKNYINGERGGTQDITGSYNNDNGGIVTKGKTTFFDTPQDDLASGIAYDRNGNPIMQGGSELSRDYATNITKTENEEIHKEKKINNQEWSNDAYTNSENGDVAHEKGTTDTRHDVEDSWTKQGRGALMIDRINSFEQNYNGIIRSFLREKDIKSLFSYFIL